MLSRDIGRQRLANQGITGEPFPSAYDVVKHLGAIQAQDYKQSLWAVGARMQSATVDAVEAAIEAGVILRTWAMRGTIHYIPAEDTRWMLDLCASRNRTSSERRMRELDLTYAIMDRCEALFRDALGGRQVVSRARLLRRVEEAGISTEGQRGYHILAHLGQKGVIAIGPAAGSEQTFVLVDDWVPALRDLSREEALIELVTRYFTSHAPATDHDFARWSGLTLSDTRRGISSIASRLHTRTINGTDYYVLNDSRPATLPPTVHLLAAYDEFLLGYKNRDAVLPPDYASRVVPGNNGVFQPLVVADGEIIGIWKRTITPQAIAINFYPFVTFDGWEAQIRAAAETVGRFMRRPVMETF